MYDRNGDTMCLLENKVEEYYKLNGEYMVYSDMLEYGFTKREIRRLVEKDLLRKLVKGLYIYKNELEDEFFVYQFANKNMIYSHETACYLHGLTTVIPSRCNVTTYSGCHLRNNRLKVSYVKKELLHVGAIEHIDYFGNKIIVYDCERTICDMIRNKKKVDAQVYYQSLQTYFNDRKLNMRKLSRFGKLFNVEGKIAEIYSLYKSA